MFATRSLTLVPAPRRHLAVVAACLALLATPTAPLRAQDPSPPGGTAKLMGLVPPDSGFILSVDDLRGQYKDIVSSRILDALSKTSIARDWLNSDKYREQQASREQVEQMLQLSLEELRDEVLGDAVVFAIHLPADATDPNQARGLVVLKAKAPEKLARVIGIINEAQRNNGEVADVAHRKHGDVEFTVRQFASGSGKPDEALVSFPDGVFALSNSEALIRDVIDRKAGKTPSTASTPSGTRLAQERFRELDRLLPARSLARVFLDPRAVERLLRNAPKPHSPGEAAIRRYLEAHEAVGAALVAGDRRIAFQLVETFDAKKLSALAGGETGGARPARIDGIPEHALAIMGVQTDLVRVYNALRRAVPEADRPKLANVEAIARGLLMGHDVRTEILPKVGPQATLIVEAPEGLARGQDAGASHRNRPPVPLSLSLELGAKEVGEALDNALQTGLAILCLDPKNGGGKAHVVETVAAGSKVRTLSVPIPAAYGLAGDGRRLVLGSSVEAVGRALAASADSAATTRYRRIQAAEFPAAHSFLCVDLAAVHSLVAAHGDALAARLAHGREQSRTVRESLSKLDEVIGLFDSASWSARFDKDNAALVQELSVVPRPAPPSGRP